MSLQARDRSKAGPVPPLFRLLLLILILIVIGGFGVRLVNFYII